MASDDARPDPDALIERIRSDEARARRGKLRIYFGSAAGVGKTFAMLAAARLAKEQGTDVVVGIVETHGRAETAALLQGLEVLPRKSIGGERTAGVRPRRRADAPARRSSSSTSWRTPTSPGSRHPKRWQDVDELIGAGIDVWTTLNVQHLESLNDVVGGITGIRVQETLPDTFFDRADEVVLVDTPADELIARLKAGKVYGGRQAERAAANFFRKGNLMALRELALRRTADRVENDVQAYRVERSIGRVWKTEAAVLCCIGPHDERRARGAQRGAARAAARGLVARGLRRDARAAAPAERAPRAHPARRQARRGAGRDDGGAAERTVAEAVVEHARAAQPVEDRHGPPPGELLAAGARRSRSSSAGSRPMST